MLLVGGIKFDRLSFGVFSFRLMCVVMMVMFLLVRCWFCKKLVKSLIEKLLSDIVGLFKNRMLWLMMFKCVNLRWCF